MKKSTYLLLSFMVIFSCKSPEKLLQEGNYDEAIEKSIKKVQKGNAKDEDKEILDKAYKFANGRDQTRLDFLLKENRPENWEEILRMYTSLDIRQAKIQKVIPFTIRGKEINYTYIDYSDNIIEAKIKAARYFYEKGVSLIKLETREAYREAFYDFQKVKNYRASDYPDLDVLMNDAIYYGTSRVLIEVENRLPMRLPAEFFREVHNINTSGLNGNWVEYHLARLDKDTYYDYYITVLLNKVLVAPPRKESREFIRTKTIQDGEKTKRDANGKIVKDSEGNPVKEPNYKEIECKVYEITHIKTATVQGEIHFVSTDPDRLIKKVPVAGTSVFEHITGRAVGDRAALLPEDSKLVRRAKPVFPEDFDMIMDCAPILRDAIADAIRNNRNVIY